MNRYHVQIYTLQYEETVEANNEEEARDKVENSSAIKYLDLATYFALVSEADDDDDDFDTSDDGDDMPPPISEYIMEDR